MSEAERRQLSGVCAGKAHTAPLVRRLMESFQLLRGQDIEHAVVEEIIELTREDDRYWTVTGAWRDLVLDDLNLVLEAVDNVGFHVLTEPERIGHVQMRMRKAARQVKRAVGVAVTTDRKMLNAVEVKRMDHLEMTASRIAHDFVADARQLQALARLTIPEVRCEHRLPGVANGREEVVDVPSDKESKS